MLRAAEHAAKPDHSIWRSINMTLAFDETQVCHNALSWIDYPMLHERMLVALLDR